MRKDLGNLGNLEDGQRFTSNLSNSEIQKWTYSLK